MCAKTLRRTTLWPTLQNKRKAEFEGVRGCLKIRLDRGGWGQEAS